MPKFKIGDTVNVKCQFTNQEYGLGIIVGEPDEDDPFYEVETIEGKIDYFEEKELTPHL